MKKTRRYGKLFGLLTTAALATFCPGAAAQQVDDQTAECLDAYQAAQELRIVGKLGSARERATFCSQERCPNAVRSGCTKWLAELVDAQPSIAITARGAGGADVSDVRVLVDGQVVAESLSGRAIEIDPGKHVVRFVHRGFPPQDQEIILSEGVKSRSISIQFGEAAPASPTPDAPRAGPSRPRDEPATVGPIVLGVAGLASIGAFATLASLGNGDLEDMRESCGVTRSCPEGRVDQARTQLIVGDILLGVGIAAIGGGFAWYVGSRSGNEPAETPLRVSVQPTRTGASTSLRGTF